MKAELRAEGVVIPRGWRKLRSNEKMRKGDRVRVGFEWHLSGNWSMKQVPTVKECYCKDYIRKIKEIKP